MQIRLLIINKKANKVKKKKTGKEMGYLNGTKCMYPQSNSDYTNTTITNTYIHNATRKSGGSEWYK